MRNYRKSTGLASETCRTSAAVTGIASVYLGGTQIAAVALALAESRAARLSDSAVMSGYGTDLRCLSLLAAGLVMGIPGLFCVRAAGGLSRGEWESQKRTLVACAILLGGTLPLAALSGSAAILSGLAAATLAILACCRTQDQRTGSTDVVTRFPERTVTVEDGFAGTSAASAQLI